MYTRELCPVTNRDVFDNLAPFSGYTALRSWFDGLDPHTASARGKAITSSRGRLYRVMARNCNLSSSFSVSLESDEPATSTVSIIGRRLATSVDPLVKEDIDLITGKELAWRREDRVILDLIPRRFTLQAAIPSSSMITYEPRILRVESAEYLEADRAEGLVSDIESLIVETARV